MSRRRGPVGSISSRGAYRESLFPGNLHLEGRRKAPADVLCLGVGGLCSFHRLGRVKAFSFCHFPIGRVARNVVRLFQEGPLLQPGQRDAGRHDFAKTFVQVEMFRLEFARMAEPGSGRKIPKGLQRVAMKIRDALRLVGNNQACWRLGSCVATPVGQRLVWQLWDWMQPTANMKPRAELTQSAPKASAPAMSNALISLPAAPIRISSRRPVPTRQLCTKVRPWRRGFPACWQIPPVRRLSRLRHRRPR